MSVRPIFSSREDYMRQTNASSEMVAQIGQPNEKI